MALTIFGPDGSKRLATASEQAREDARVAAEPMEHYLAQLRALQDYKATQKMLKGFRDKGLEPSRTRSGFAHRMRENPGAAVRFESWIARRDKDGVLIPPTLDWKDWDPIAHGEGTTYRFTPRTRLKDAELFDVWAERPGKGRRKQRRLIRRGFKQNCGEGECGRMVCAMCWAIAHADVTGEEAIRVKSTLGDNIKVVDPSGVNPKGLRKSRTKDLDEDQRARFALTSTIHHHKEGASQAVEFGSKDWTTDAHPHKPK